MTGMIERRVVTLQEIAAQRAKGWPDFHPEDYCHRCGTGNINWWIDSDRFNAAMGGLPDGHAGNGIICIQCFVELHEAATGLRCSWTLVPGTPFRPIETPGQVAANAAARAFAAV